MKIAIVGDEITATSPVASEAGEGTPPNVSPDTTPPPPSMLSPLERTIERMLNDPACDMDLLERMFAFEERRLARQAEIEFNEAMARLHKALADVRIIKTKSVLYDVDKADKGKGRTEAFRYTPLDEIDKVVRPLLNAEDMVPTYTAEIREGGGAVVVARLTHKNGHYREASIPLPLDSTGGKSNVQAMGSTFSYGRRYTLCMLLNIVTLDDDDGTGGTIDKAQAKTIRELLERAHTDDSVWAARPIEEFEAAFLKKIVHAPSIEEIPFRLYRKATSALEEKITKEKAAANG